MVAGVVPVRFPEGVVHGFLLLRQADGTVIAAGDLLQINRGGTVESRTVFRFNDKSVSDETVIYTQQGIFNLQRYRSLQQGPSFKTDQEILLERPGRYVVKSKDHEQGKQEILSGTLDL